MQQITACLYTWGAYKKLEFEHNDFSETNILYRVQHEGDVQSQPSRDKILGFDPSSQPGYVIDINAAWLKLEYDLKWCIAGKYVFTQTVNEDGQLHTAKDAAKVTGFSDDEFNKNVSKGRREIAAKVKL